MIGLLLAGVALIAASLVVLYKLYRLPIDQRAKFTYRNMLIHIGVAFVLFESGGVLVFFSLGLWN